MSFYKLTLYTTATIVLGTATHVYANSPKEQQTPQLYRFTIPENYYHGKWGLVDTQSKLIGNLDYKRLVKSEHGQANIVRYVAQLPNDRYQYLNGRGQPLNQDTFDAAKTFSDEGLARFQQGDKWGYIDLKGNIAIPAIYEHAQYFSEGLAAVKQDDEYFYIDTQGKTAIAGPFEKAEAFAANGLAAAMPEGDDKYGYIDRTGTWVIEPTFEEAKPFSSGNIASVKLAESSFSVMKNLWHSFITEDLEKIKSDKPWGAINASGDWLIEPSFHDLSDFYHGLAVATLFDDKWIINKDAEQLEESYTGNITFYPQCNLINSEAYTALHHYDLSYYQRHDDSSITWLGHLNEQCQGIARINERWGIWNQSEDVFTPFAEQYHEPLKTHSIWSSLADDRLIPLIRQDHTLEYIDIYGNVHFYLANNKQGYLIAKNPEGETLWTTTLQKLAYFPFDLEPSNEEIGFDPKWLKDPKGLLKSLETTEARHFDPTSWSSEYLFYEDWPEEELEYEIDDNTPFAKVMLLAEEQISETDVAAFPYKEQEERIHAIYNQMIDALKDTLGEPLPEEEGENVWDTWDEYASVWQTDTDYIVLQHYKAWGDGETMETLLLIKFAIEENI